MRILLQDLRYAFRAFRRSPGFAAIAILTLALGIGANTAIFSVVDAVLLRDLPFRQASRLVFLFATSPARGVDTDVTSIANYLDWRNQSTVFERVGGFDTDGGSLTSGGEPEAVALALVSSNFFEVLGVRPALGRSFRDGEDGVNPAPVVMLGHDLWVRRFGGDRGVVGRTIQIDGVSKQVVGVLPAGSEFPPDSDIWQPLALPKDLEAQRGAFFFNVLGRLKPGVSVARASSELKTIAARLAQDHPRTNAGWSATAVPFRDQLVREYRTLLLLLLGAVGFVLLIACANVANLLLARGASREREIATRAALGAGSARLVRQLLTEGLALSLSGALLGVFAAQGALAAFVQALPTGLPPWMSPSINLPVLLFTLGACLLTTLVFGSLPALHALQSALITGLGGAGRQGGAGRAARSQKFLVVSEVALALILLSGAGLVLKSLHRLQGVAPGFHTDSVVAGRLSLPSPRYDEAPARRALVAAVVERLRATPGIAAASAAQTLPLSGVVADTHVRIEGQPELAPADRPVAGFDSVTPGYFATMGIPFRDPGSRDFSSADDRGATSVAIVNEAMARRFWAGETAIGKRFTIGKDTTLQIVGVVGDVRRARLSEAETPHFYLPFAQRSSGFFFVVARGAGGASGSTTAQAIIRAVRSEDPLLSVAAARPIETMRRSSLAIPRFATLLLSGFAALALLLAALGLYGVLAHAVSRRTAEIGIRMAIGARPSDVFALVARESLRLTAVGLMIGLAAALALTRLLRGMLFEVGPADPPTLLGVSILLLSVAFFATWLPARRATAISPIEALRQE
ncbi:MAG: ABC transporter permease [Acidobacteriota bacterium]|nr:ABC transporter permease [Acidobacteriota bacterium]